MLSEASTIVETMNKKLHVVRLKNMELRKNQTDTTNKISALTKENKQLKEKVEALDKKIVADCDTYLA